MKTRFDLEHDINSMYSTADDIATIAQVMTDSDEVYDNDRVFNLLNGLSELLNAKVVKLEDTFKQVYELDQYRPQSLKDKYPF